VRATVQVAKQGEGIMTLAIGFIFNRDQIAIGAKINEYDCMIKLDLRILRYAKQKVEDTIYDVLFRPTAGAFSGCAA
jgi:hypothetical protein